MKNKNLIVARPRIRDAFVLLIVISLGSGCVIFPTLRNQLEFPDASNLRVDDLRLARTGIEPQDSVAIVIAETAAPSSSALEDNLASCLRDALHASAHRSVRLFTSDELSRGVFPDLETQLARDGSWEKLLNDASVQRRIAFFKLRYLVALSVAQEKSSSEAHLDHWTWQRGTVVSGKVVDVKHIRMAGKVTVSVHMQSAPGVANRAPFFSPIPFAIPSIVEDRACVKFGHALVKFLASDEPAPQIVMTSLTLDKLFSQNQERHENRDVAESASKGDGLPGPFVLSTERAGPTVSPFPIAHNQTISPAHSASFDDLKLAATRHMVHPTTFVSKEAVDYEDAKYPWRPVRSAGFQSDFCREIKLSLSTLAFDSKAIPPLPSRWHLGAVWIAKLISLPHQLLVPVMPIVTAPLNPTSAVWGIETLYNCAS